MNYKARINIILISLSCLLILSCASLNSNRLYSCRVDIKNDSGKDLIMTFDEIEKDGYISTIKVKHSSGASVASVMFIARGLCQISKMRGEQNFITIKDWTDEEDNWIYLVAFTSDRKIDIKKLLGKYYNDKIREDAFMPEGFCERLFKYNY